MDSLFNIDFSSLVQQIFFPFVRILALLIAFLLPLPSIESNLAIFSLIGIWVTAQQLIIGVAIGFTMQLAFMTARFAGELVGMQIGLAMATFFDPAGGPTTSVLSRLFNLIALLIFLSLDGHLWLLYSLSESFHIIPIGAMPLKADGYLTLIEASSLVFINGIMLALPLITLLLILNMALGLLNRMTPQLSIFVVGFPATLLLGLIMLSYLIPTIAPYCEYIFALFFEKISTVLLYLVY